MLGTFVEVSLLESESQKTQEAIDQAFEVIYQVHCLMSFHNSMSDVSRLNRGAFQEPVKVHPWTYEVLKKSAELSLLTKGLFDCTVAPQLVKWEYLPGQVEKKSKSWGSYEDIKFLSAHKISFRNPLMIDLGGIAKGFAVDQAVTVLKSAGMKNGSVNAGGDLKIFGRKNQPVYVKSPSRPSDLVLIGEVKEMSVATSSHYYSRKYLKGRQVSSIMNPLQNKPCLKKWSVSVMASSCMTADALTKVVMLAGDAAKSFLEKYEARAVIIRK